MLRNPLRAFALGKEVRILIFENPSVLSACLAHHDLPLSIHLPARQALHSQRCGRSGELSTRSFGQAPLAPFRNVGTRWNGMETAVECGRRCMSEASKDPGTKESSSDAKRNLSANSGTLGSSEESGRELDSRRMVDFTSGKMLYRAEGLKGVARRASESKEAPPDSTKPIIVYSSSLLWGDSALGGILRSLASLGTWIQSYLLCRFIDKDFNLHDFLEGCNDASFMVNQLFGECAWDTLGNMVSTRLLKTLKEVSEEFRQNGLKFSMTTEHIRNSYIQSVNVCDEDLITKFDSTLSSRSGENIESREEDVERFWIMIGVRILSKERLKVWKNDGEVVSDTLSQRNDLWVFARGPFNNAPMVQEETNNLQWTLISVG